MDKELAKKFDKLIDVTSQNATEGSYSTYAIISLTTMLLGATLMLIPKEIINLILGGELLVILGSLGYMANSISYFKWKLRF